MFKYSKTNELYMKKKEVILKGKNNTKYFKCVYIYIYNKNKREIT